MAQALKCDRCGRLYPSANKSIKFQNLWIGNKEGWDSGPKDVCPDCVRDFLIWWNYSNISAAYEFDRIQSEMNAHEDHAQDT